MERNRKERKVRVNFSEHVVCISRGLACGVPREGIVPRGGQTEWERNTRKDQQRFVGGGVKGLRGELQGKK